MFRQSSASETENLLLWVRKGMPVHDSDDKHIGRIKSIYFGYDSVADQPVVLDKLHDLPPEVQEALTRDGFIEIDTGFLSSNLLARRSNLEEITDTLVRLNVTRDALIKP
jgi:hypothetical protein